MWRSFISLMMPLKPRVPLHRHLCDEWSEGRREGTSSSVISADGQCRRSNTVKIKTHTGRWRRRAGLREAEVPWWCRTWLVSFLAAATTAAWTNAELVSKMRWVQQRERDSERRGWGWWRESTEGRPSSPFITERLLTSSLHDEGILAGMEKKKFPILWSFHQYMFTNFISISKLILTILKYHYFWKCCNSDTIIV